MNQQRLSVILTPHLTDTDEDQDERKKAVKVKKYNTEKKELLERSSVLIGKKFRQIYLPACCCSLSNIIVIAIDSVVAGRLIGATALAAVTLFMPVRSMDEVIFDLCGSGMTTNIGKLRGAHEVEKSNQFFTFTLLRMLCVYLFFCSFLLLFARPVLAFFSDDEKLITMALEYFYPMVSAMPFMSLMTGLKKVFRIDGRPTFFSSISVVESVTNTILDFVFVQYFTLGIRGLAYATIISSLFSSAIMLTHVFMGKCSLRLDFRILKDWKTCRQYRKNMIKSGQAYAINDGFGVLTNSFMNKLIVSVGGSVGLAAYGIFNTLNNICGSLTLSISTSTSLLGGVFYGEGDLEGVKIVLRRARILISRITVFLVVFTELFAGVILLFYQVRDPLQLSMGYAALRIGCLSFLFYGFIWVYIQYLVAVEKEKFATFLSVLELGLKLPIAWIGAYFFGMNGIWISFVIVEMLAFLPVFYQQLKRNLYFLPDIDTSQLHSFSFVLSEENTVKASRFSEKAVVDGGFPKILANRVALLIEESGIYILNENKDSSRSVNCEIRIRVLENKLYVVVCDDGKLFNPICEVKKNGFREPENMEQLMLNAFSSQVTYDRILELNYLVLCCQEKEG